MKNTEKNLTPAIDHRAFWNLPEVKKVQEIQKHNPPTSKAWQDAEDELVRIGAQFGAEKYL